MHSVTLDRFRKLHLMRSIVTTLPFSERNNLVNKRCRNRANYFSIIRCRVTQVVTDSDEERGALWGHCVYVVASRKVNFIVLRVRNALYITIETIRGVTSGERFKKNFYCGVYEVISV